MQTHIQNNNPKCKPVFKAMGKPFTRKKTNRSRNDLIPNLGDLCSIHPVFFIYNHLIL